MNRTRGKKGVRIVALLTAGLLLIIVASSRVSQAQQQVNIEIITNPTPLLADKEISLTFNAKDAAGYLVMNIDYVIRLIENSDPDYPSGYLDKKVHSDTGSHVEKLTLPPGRYEADVQIVGINFYPVTPISRLYKFEIAKPTVVQPPPAAVPQPAPPPPPQQVQQPAPALSISVAAAPTSATPGEKMTFTWEVKGLGKIVHTAVHWDTKPGNPADFKSYAKATPDFASLNPAQDAPKKFTVTVDAPTSGVIYYVVHAIVDGKNVYNPDGEKKITISAPPAPQAQAPQQQAPAPAPAQQPAPRPEPQVVSKPESSPMDFTLVAGGIAVVVVVAIGFAIFRTRKH
ncbi:MAG: hypothetical protein HYU02_04220 [Thaumarchaeota archaeon]|nr:hypothetical protein [Nitrososphaerota archaeon]